jgi:hypothetical protein
MKKIALVLTIILISIAKAQSVSDYKYITIPSEFNDFKDNKSYGLTSLLAKTLKSKKYIVLPQAKSSWPAEAQTNPCSILNADVLNDKSMFRNKVILEFRDCNNKVIVTEKASSTIKEFEPGFQDALKMASAKIPVSNPNIQNIVKSEVLPVQEEQKPAEAPVANAQTAQRFTKGNLTLQKIQIDNTQFILADGNSSTPFATFKATAKNDVYRVKLSSGESTIGYYENGNIIIEMPKDGDFVKEVFTAK